MASGTRIVSPPATARTAAAFALAFNAFVWGTSWWPLRALEARQLHPLWTTVLVYALAAAAIAAARPRAMLLVARTPALWVLVVASGTTNAAFNWAVVAGDVVRVVLLFYLMPVWALLLARMLLGEPMHRGALLRASVALLGAAVVLAPPDGPIGWPLPRSLADWLGLLGSFAFALNNVMLRREAHRPEEGRALAMFFGGVAIAGSLAMILALRGAIAWPPAAAPGWVAGALALAMLFLASNLALQFGAARLPANVTAVVMLTEVVFAAVSAVAFGGAEPTPAVLAGGTLIVLAAASAARSGP